MPDFEGMLVPDMSLLETVLRGTLTYFGVLLLLRVVVKQAGSLSLTDLLLVVLIADAVQNAMSAEYNSLSNGLVLAATLVFWSISLDWLGYRVPAIGNVLHPRAIPIIENGRELQRNMRRELITREELLTRVRLAGGEDIGDVKKAWVEGNGEVSVLLYDSKPQEAETTGQRIG